MKKINIRLILGLLMILSFADLVSTKMLYISGQPSDDQYKCYSYFSTTSVLIYQFNGHYDAVSKKLLDAKRIIGNDNYAIIDANDSPKLTLQNFAKNVDSTLYKTLWLGPTSGAINCDILKTYVYECASQRLKCGFYFSDGSWEWIAKNNRLSCPQLAALPLLYWGSKDSFKPLGGWVNYTFILTGRSAICPVENIYLYNVEPFSQINQKQY